MIIKSIFLAMAKAIMKKKRARGTLNYPYTNYRDAHKSIRRNDKRDIIWINSETKKK